MSRVIHGTTVVSIALFAFTVRLAKGELRFKLGNAFPFPEAEIDELVMDVECTFYYTILLPFNRETKLTTAMDRHGWLFGQKESDHVR